MSSGKVVAMVAEVAGKLQKQSRRGRVAVASPVGPGIRAIDPLYCACMLKLACLKLGI